MKDFSVISNENLNINVKKLIIERKFIDSVLFLIFLMSFIFVPCWKMAETAILQYTLLFISLFLGTGWAYWAGSNVSFFWERNNLILNGSIFILFLFGILFLNYNALHIGIPWRGDEDYHILYTLKTIYYLFDIQKPSLIPLIFLSVLFLSLAFRKSALFLPVGVLLVIFSVLSVEMIDQNLLQAYGNRQLFLRYPFASRWIHAVVIYISQYFDSSFNEINYRIIPLLCSAILVWYTIRYFKKTNIVLACLWGLAIGTIPVIVYYSSILYLEMPAIVLMTVVCMNAEKLLIDDPDSIKHNPAWYALLLIGFIKDNTLPFLLCFLLMRFVINVLKKKSEKKFLQRLGQENIIGFCVLFPLALFLCFRWGFLDKSDLRHSDITRLLDYDVFSSLIRSFGEQIGLISLLLIPALVILIRSRRYHLSVFLCLNIIMISLFQMIFLTEYVGYSRFNLLLVPAFITASNIVIFELAKKKKFILIITLTCIIIVNFLMTPLNIDGTKKSFWGNYLADTSEHYYPYREMIFWLKENHTSKRILFANNGYPYPSLQFYFLKFNWNPTYLISNDIQLLNICKKSEEFNIDLIVFQPPPKNPDYQPVLGCGYSFEHKVSNMEYSLIVYKKDSGSHINNGN